MAVLCHADEVTEGCPRGIAVGPWEVIVLREGTQLRVYQNRCPHLGIPLEWLPDQFMDPSGDLLRCSTHGALFLPESGECVAGPCLGQYLRPLPFRLANGWVTLTLPTQD